MKHGIKGLPMKMMHKLWLEKDGKVIFGRGRDTLLKAIDEYHSLNAAAKKLNMSYRAAWGRLRASEDRMGTKLVEVEPSGKGMHLTATAKLLIKTFDELDRNIGAMLNQASEELLTIAKNHKTTP
jgi:molybdate transport system regulatory protein